MITYDLARMIPENHYLTSDQQLNILDILDKSRIFADEAGYDSCNFSSVNEDTILIESGHQPNFLPYSGVLKKAFLLHKFHEMLDEIDVQSIGIFGFLDQNMATASFLYKNQVPAINKNGAQKIGFSVKRSDKWKRFNTIEKPLPDQWEGEMAKIEKMYSDILSKNSEIFEIFQSSYERAESFSDLNAFIFSRIVREVLGLNVHFFRYSDIKCGKLFSNECIHLLRKKECYNTIYNEEIRKNNLRLKPVFPEVIPFWYHCDCGGKTALLMNIYGVCKGKCPVCGKEYELEFGNDFSKFDTYSEDVSFSAVSRNLIFSEGLGTHFFISGPGGGLSYGKISIAISKAIGFNLPLTYSWSSKDYYLGNVHKEAINELLNTFSLRREDLLKSTLNESIRAYQRRRNKEIREIKGKKTKNGLRMNTGRLTGSTQANMVSRIFSIVPSMLEIFMHFSRDDILTSWEDGLACSIYEQYDSSCALTRDIVYSGRDGQDYTPDEIVFLFNNLSEIGDEQK